MFVSGLRSDGLSLTMSERPDVISDFDLSGEEALRLLAFEPEDLIPEDAFFRSEIARIVDELPHQIRTVALLVGVDDMRQEEVAVILRVDQSTISRRWKRALELVERGLAND
jgi:DNA-directed RNA polymerase specialized sigma24 family protein